MGHGLAKDGNDGVDTANIFNGNHTWTRAQEIPKECVRNNRNIILVYYSSQRRVFIRLKNISIILSCLAAEGLGVLNTGGCMSREKPFKLSLWIP